jgi:hypothetical protein
MFQQNRFRDDGTYASWLRNSQDSNNDVDTKKDDMAHSRIVTDRKVFGFRPELAIRHPQVLVPPSSIRFFAAAAAPSRTTAERISAPPA